MVEADIPSVTRVDDIKDKLEDLKGERLKVKANLGRGRISEHMGTLLDLYPRLFNVEVEERRGRTTIQSYQYVDILTGTVELFFADSGEKLFDFAPAEDDADADAEDEEDLAKEAEEALEDEE